jgi:hypothetical protein
MNAEQIDLEGLIAAVETELPDVEHYLDLRSGQILIVVKTDGTEDISKLDQIARDNLALSRCVHLEPEAYERIPSIASDAALRWMQEWAATVADDEMRDRLERVLRSCTDDCFRAFRQELSNAPQEERERWFAFREEKLAEFVTEWAEGRKKRGRGRAAGEKALGTVAD